MAAAALAPSLPTVLLALVLRRRVERDVHRPRSTRPCSSPPSRALRGRVMALWSVVFLGSTPIGGPLVGWLSAASRARARACCSAPPPRSRPGRGSPSASCARPRSPPPGPEPRRARRRALVRSPPACAAPPSAPPGPPPSPCSSPRPRPPPGRTRTTVRAGFAPRDAALRLDGPGLALRQRGAIAVRTPAGDVRATRILRRSARSVTLATPDGRTRSPSPCAGGRRGRSASSCAPPAAPSRACASPSRAGRAERFLGFGERADAVEQRGRDVDAYVSRRPVPGPRPRASPRRSPRPGPAALATTRRTTRSRGCSRPAATACSSTSDETQRLRPPRPPPRDLGVEVAAPRLRAAGLRRPDARPTRCAASPPRPAASRAPPAVGLRPVVPDRPAERDAAGRRGGRPGEAARRPTRRSPPPRPSCTTCRAAPDRGREDYEARACAVCHATGLAVLTYVNPMLCAVLRAAVRPGAPAAGALQRARRRAAAHVRLVRGRHRLGGLHGPAGRQFDFTRRRGAALYARRRCARSLARRPRRLDGGLRRVHAARRASPPTGSAARRCTTATRASYHCAAAAPRARAAGRSCASSARAGPGAARCARRRVGRRPDDDVGLRRAALGGRAGASDRACPASAAGAPTSAATTRSGTTRSSTPELLDALDRARRGLGRDAHQERRHRASRPTRARRSGTPAIVGDVAALREAAHAALPLPRGRRRELPRDRAAAHAPPRARVSRPTRARPRATTSSASAPTCSPRRCSSPGRAARGACTCRAGRGSTSGAASRYARGDGGLAPSPRAPAGRGPRASRCPRPLRRAAAPRPRRRGPAAAAARRRHARALRAGARPGPRRRPRRPASIGVAFPRGRGRQAFGLRRGVRRASWRRRLAAGRPRPPGADVRRPGRADDPPPPAAPARRPRRRAAAARLPLALRRPSRRPPRHRAPGPAGALLAVRG